MPRGAFPECCSQCPRPLVSPCQPAPPEETLEHQQVVLAQSPVGSLLLSSVSWCTQGSVCALQDWRLCFPQSCGSLVIKSHWPSRSDSLGIPSPFVRSPGWEAWRGFRTFTTAGKLLWYYCHPVYESPTGWVWNFILSWLCPSYCLAMASSLSLEMGYLLWVGSASSCWRLFNSLLWFWCSHSRRWPHRFYSAILNWKLGIYVLTAILLIVFDLFV